MNRVWAAIKNRSKLDQVQKGGKRYYWLYNYEERKNNAVTLSVMIQKYFSLRKKTNKQTKNKKKQKTSNADAA